MHDFWNSIYAPIIIICTVLGLFGFPAFVIWLIGRITKARNADMQLMITASVNSAVEKLGERFDRNDTATEHLGNQLADFGTRLVTIETQFKRNSGSSVLDKIEKTNEVVTKVQVDVATFGAKLDTHLQQVTADHAVRFAK